MEVKEFGVPDTVKSMSWCGENICLGIKREYVILNATSGALTDVFPSGRLAPPLVVSLPSGELLLGKVCIASVLYSLHSAAYMFALKIKFRSNAERRIKSLVTIEWNESV